MSTLTKKALAQSLKDLCAEKPLTKITIGELCERTGVRRQTFYYHFNDIADLVEWIGQTEADAALKQNRDYTTWEEGFLDIFRLAKKEEPFIMNIYHSVSKDTLIRYLYHLTLPLLNHVVNEVAERLLILDVTQKDKDFIANFYTVSFIDIVIGWVDRGMTDDPKAIIHHLSPLIKGTIPNALNAYSGRK